MEGRPKETILGSGVATAGVVGLSEEVGREGELDEDGGLAADMVRGDK